jgi:hypothetical protein
MQEVRDALENLCTAASLAAPWNFSFKMLAIFLRSTNNMEAQLAAYKKAPIIAAFIDHVLHCNANKWLADADFYDLPALEALWRNWWIARRSCGADDKLPAGQAQSGGGSNASGDQSAAKSRNQLRKERKKNRGSAQGGPNAGGGGGQQSHQGQQGGFAAGGQPAIHIAPANERNLCRRYNDGHCPNPHGRCSTVGKYGPFKLYHLCNFTNREPGKPVETCMQRHARAEFHKAN